MPVSNACSRTGRREIAFQPVAQGPLVQAVIRELECQAADRIIDRPIGDLPVASSDKTVLRLVFVILFLCIAANLTRVKPPALIFIRVPADRLMFVRSVRECF